MPEESSITPAETGLVVRPPTGLVSLPDGASSALSEIIKRSVAQIKTGGILATSEQRPGDEQEFEIAPGVKIVMCWIPPGEFLMGSPSDETGRCDDETQRRVTLTRGFWLGKYQISQAQWEAVMGNNPSHFKGSDLPVESISWDDISQPDGFIEKVNRFAAAERIFSLPTEAQWEYACRAGTTTALNSGKSLTSCDGYCPNLEEVAWYGRNSNRTTHPVGLKKANGWGLHDMHGNVFEWCLGKYGEYPEKPLIDPQGPDPGYLRVVRGGGWSHAARGCRAANRGWSDPDEWGTYSSTGFRVAHSAAP